MATIIRNPKRREPAEGFVEGQAEEQEEPTSYLDKAKALVPATVVAFWIAAIGAIDSAIDNPTPLLLWIIFVIGLLGTWLVTNNELKNAKDYDPQNDRVGAQVLLTTISFAVWVSGFGGGGPFGALPGYLPVYGELAILAWTMLLAPSFAGLINRRDEPPG